MYLIRDAYQVKQRPIVLIDQYRLPSLHGIDTDMNIGLHIINWHIKVKTIGTIKKRQTSKKPACNVVPKIRVKQHFISVLFKPNSFIQSLLLQIKPTQNSELI